MTDHNSCRETGLTPFYRQKTKPETAPIACHRRKGMYISTCRSARQEKEKGVFQSHGSLGLRWEPLYEPQQAINEVYDSFGEGKSTSFRTHFLTNSRIYFCRFEKLRTFQNLGLQIRQSGLLFSSSPPLLVSLPQPSRARTHIRPRTRTQRNSVFCLHPSLANNTININLLREGKTSN